MTLLPPQVWRVLLPSVEESNTGDGQLRQDIYHMDHSSDPRCQFLIRGALIKSFLADTDIRLLTSHIGRYRFDS